MHTISITFKVQFKAVYGEALYLIGNTPQLGNWDVNNSIRLKWENGDIWIVEVLIPWENQEKIEYKYALADFKNPSEYKWEKGPNRHILFKPENINKQSSPFLYILRDDKWQQRKVIIKLAVNQQQQQATKNCEQQEIKQKEKKEEENVSEQNEQKQQSEIPEIPVKLQKQYELKQIQEEKERKKNEDIYYIKGNLSTYQNDEIHTMIKMVKKSRNQSNNNVQQQSQDVGSMSDLISPEFLIPNNKRKISNFSNNNTPEQQQKITISQQKTLQTQLLQNNKQQIQQQKQQIQQQQNQQLQQQQQNTSQLQEWYEGEGWIDIEKNQKLKYCFQKGNGNLVYTDRQSRKIDISTYFQNRDKLVLVNSQTLFDFKFSKIDSNLAVGPYPQGEADIKQLKQFGIEAVLNLQTEEDMEFRGIGWSKYQEYYQKQNIKAYNFPIIDMDCQDMSTKLIQVSQLLHLILQSYKCVYIHCTAGIYRSPQTIIGYYCFFKKMEVNQAINLMEKQHPISQKNRSYLKRVLANLIQEHNSNTEDNQESQYEPILNQLGCISHNSKNVKQQQQLKQNSTNNNLKSQTYIQQQQQYNSTWKTQNVYLKSQDQLSPQRKQSEELEDEEQREMVRKFKQSSQEQLQDESNKHQQQCVNSN